MARRNREPLRFVFACLPEGPAFRLPIRINFGEAGSTDYIEICERTPGRVSVRCAEGSLRVVPVASNWVEVYRDLELEERKPPKERT